MVIAALSGELYIWRVADVGELKPIDYVLEE